jgi:hypothetical protein
LVLQLAPFAPFQCLAECEVAFAIVSEEDELEPFEVGFTLFAVELDLAYGIFKPLWGKFREGRVGDLILFELAHLSVELFLVLLVELDRA